MTNINWDEFKCRASCINKMMATKKGKEPISETGLRKIKEFESRDKEMTEKMKIEYAALVYKRDNPPPDELADGAIEYLMEVYAWKTEGMIPVGKESMDLLQLKKGKMVEEASGLLLNVVDGVIYQRHKERISNDYLSGEIDFYLGESVMQATRIVDTKNAQDYPGYLKKINNGLENGQKEQLQGYGDISGAKELFIANCLVSNPFEIIEEMKWKVMRKLGCATSESPEFLEEWPKWEKSMIFDSIAQNKRVHKIPVEPFTEFERQAVYDRVKFCRDWLWKFDETFQKMNL